MYVLWYNDIISAHNTCYSSFVVCTGNLSTGVGSCNVLISDDYIGIGDCKGGPGLYSLPPSLGFLGTNYDYAPGGFGTLSAGIFGPPSCFRPGATGQTVPGFVVDSTVSNPNPNANSFALQENGTILWTLPPFDGPVGKYTFYKIAQ